MSSPIKEFPQDGQPWRIEWIGRIFKDGNDIKVRVHISRLKPSSPKNTALNNASLAGYEEKIYDQRHHDLPIGFIHRLKIGSVWINTEEQLDYRALEESFEIADPSTLRLLTLTNEGYEKTEVGEWRPALSNRQYRVADNARYGTSVVMIYGHPKYKQIIIPSPVIFQSCYVTSPKAASKFLFGQLDKMVDKSDSGYVQGKESTYRVHLHKDYKDVEGVMLAHFLLDQTAQRNLKLLNRYNQMEAVESYQPIYAIKIGFPFSSKIKLKVLGKEISYPADDKTRKQDETGFLVTQLLSVKTQFAFDELLPARKNDAKKGDMLADNLKESWPGAAPQSSDSDEESPLTDDEVSANLEDTKADLPDIVDLMGVKILKRESKEFQNYLSKPFKPHGSVQAVKTGVSSGEKKQITVGASQLDTTSAPVELDAIFEVLKHLRNHNIDVQELAVLNAELSDKGIVNYFPHKYIPGRRWHRKEDNSGGRAFVIAQLYLAGQFYYLIDIEARGSGLSICLVCNRNHTAIPTEEFKKYMRTVVIKRGWAAFTETYAKNLAFHKVNHDHHQKDFANVAKNILKVLNH